MSLYKKGAKSLEDDFSSLLINLYTITIVPDTFVDGHQVMKLLYDSKFNLPAHIFLFAILDHFENQFSISVNDIQLEVSDLFLCNREGTELKLYQLQEKRYLVFKDNAGRKEIQLTRSINKWDILKDYYGKSI